MHYTTEGRLFTEIVLELFKLSGVLVSEGDKLTKDLGLSSARWKVLGALALSNNPLTVAEIARSMGQTRQGVQRLTDDMEQEGILAYQDNPRHKRAKLVGLTPKGKKIYSKLEQKQIPWANTNSSNMSAKNMLTTLSVLRQMTQLLEPK
jgi:DNA-binding MarR family transcriptional regulator